MRITYETHGIIYGIKTSTGDMAFCNGSQIADVIDVLGCKAGYYGVYNIAYGFKATKLSKSKLKQVYEANGVPEFKQRYP